MAVRVVKTYLTSEALKSTGVRTGRIKVDYNIDKKQSFLKKKTTTTTTTNKTTTAIPTLHIRLWTGMNVTRKQTFNIENKDFYSIFSMEKDSCPS